MPSGKWLELDDWAQMASDGAPADDIGWRFDHVMVDDYQDMNACSRRSVSR
jgi:hypothetical protein